MPDEPAAEGLWLPIAEAARKLGVTPQAVRGRIGRGTLETREEVRGNRRKTLVRVPDTVPDPAPGTAPDAVHRGVDHRDEALAALRAHIAAVEAALAVERERVDRLLAALAERRAPSRRRWPGLRAWWRRLIEGEG